MAGFGRVRWSVPKSGQSGQSTLPSVQLQIGRRIHQFGHVDTSELVHYDVWHINDQIYGLFSPLFPFLSDFLMVRPKSWHWEHFYKSDKKYGNNNTHWAAYCNHCVKAKLSALELQEKQAVRDGRLQAERSRDILIIEAREATFVTSGKVSVMNNHLIQCEYCPDSVKAKAKIWKGSDEAVDAYEDSNSQASTTGGKPSEKRDRSDSSAGHTDARMKRQRQFTVVAAKSIPFNAERQEAFEDQILRAFVSAGFAFYAIHDPEVKKLFRDFLPGATLPDRKILSGKILMRQVVKMEGELQESGRGQYATIQSDGYKDIAKRHLLAFMYTALRQAHVTNIHDMSALRKTGANLYSLMAAEYEYLTGTIGLRCIGIAGDAAGDERKARLDMRGQHPNLLIADCWAHQICLILGDYVRANKKVAEVIDSAVEVVKWFNNHSFALGIFRKEQREMLDGKEWSLVMPVITRWTAYYASFDRLLKLRKALQVTAIKHESELIDALGNNAPPRKKLKARRVLSRIKDDNWWKKLVVIKSHFEPLAIATNVTQGANSRCDQVLFLLAKLYNSYSTLRQADCDHPESTMTEEEHPVSAILDSIEKRWRKADQDLFISAFFLNPLLSQSLLNPAAMSSAMIMGILRRLYMRVFEVDQVPSDFMSSVYQYSQREGIFSSTAWPVKDIGQALSEEDGSIDPIKLWNLLPPANSLVRLAILILSFVPNSTNTERLFTTITDTKTKKRNRLLTERLRKIVFVKLELRRQQAVEGTARARLKRHFGNDETGAVTVSAAEDQSGSRMEEEDILRTVEDQGIDDASETGEEPSTPANELPAEDLGHVQSETPVTVEGGIPVRSFVVMTRELEEELSKEDGDVDDAELDERGITTADHVEYSTNAIRRVRLYFGEKRLFDVAELFNFTIDKGWDEYWFQGVKNYEEEASFYELLTSLDKNPGAPSDETRTTPRGNAGEGSENPIVLS